MKLLSTLALLLALVVSPRALAQEMKSLATFQGPKTGVAALAISPDGKYLAIAGKEAINLHEAATGKIVGTFKTSAVSITFSAKGDLLALCDRDNWNTVVSVPELRPTTAVGAHALGSPRK